MSRKHRRHREAYEEREEHDPAPVVENAERPALAELKAAGEPENLAGLVCRKCHCSNFKVEYTRHREQHIMRRRQCRSCGAILVTHERPAFG